MDSQKITADGDKHSGFDPGVETHGKREGKAENSQYYNGKNAMQQQKKGWLQEILALDCPSAPIERSAQKDAGCMVGKGPGSGGDRPGFVTRVCLRFDEYPLG